MINYKHTAYPERAAVLDSSAGSYMPLLRSSAEISWKRDGGGLHVHMERQCCPFIKFQLCASGDKADWPLKLTGPEGVKALLKLEFPPD